MNKLKVGMRFDNMIQLCEFVGWEYDYKHSTRLSNRLSEYVSFHRENRNNIVIDEVINPNVEMIQFKRRRAGYDYKVGDIVNINNGQAEILKQTHVVKNKLKRKAYKAKCLKCGYVYTDYDYNFYKQIGCGCCNGKVVVKGINDIWTVKPGLAKLLANPEDGYKYTIYSKTKVDWICPDCNSLHRDKSIANIANRGLSCLCRKSKSYPNRFMFWLLTELEVEFYDEKTFDWSDGKRYDFYIPSANVIVEMHGAQHYYENHNFTRKSLEWQKENDNQKRNLATSNGVANYIEINCSKSDFDFIKCNVINSELSFIYSLKDVNWVSLKEKCETNILQAVANCWNNGVYVAEDIGNIVGLSKAPIRKYLNRCEEFGLIKKYDKEIIERIRAKKTYSTIYQNRATPIKCNENGLCFGSLSLCTQKMNDITGKTFHRGNVVGTITGKYKQHHNYTFSYITRKEFNESKLKNPSDTFGDLFIDETLKLPA